MDLQLAIDYLKELFSDKLASYHGDNIAYILKTLRGKETGLHAAAANSNVALHAGGEHGTGGYSHDGKHIQVS